MHGRGGGICADRTRSSFKCGPDSEILRRFYLVNYQIGFTKVFYYSK